MYLNVSFRIEDYLSKNKERKASLEASWGRVWASYNSKLLLKVAVYASQVVLENFCLFCFSKDLLVSFRREEKGRGGESILSRLQAEHGA